MPSTAPGGSSKHRTRASWQAQQDSEQGLSVLRGGLLGVLLLIAQVARADPAVTVGSKNFTEAVVLGEVAASAARQAGVRAAHRRQLGGTRILWRALEAGEIDAYAEYTGTLKQELLQRPDASDAQVRDLLAQHGLAMTASLGFENT